MQQTNSQTNNGYSSEERALLANPDEQQKSSHQVSDENFVENSSDMRRYGISDDEEFQEESIIPDQKNLADGIQEMCSGYQVDPNISSDILLGNISHEFSQGTVR